MPLIGDSFFLVIRLQPECQVPMKTELRKSSKPNGCELIVQPADGIDPIVKAIQSAKERIEILIFRFDRSEIEEALIAAVKRGVAVQALIAWTNRGGERNLRNLETRLLAAGVTVSRTANDLARYHGKMLIVDRKRLYLLAFNFTGLDINMSRSFGIVSNSRTLVAEAVKLFEADSNRQPYTPVKGGLLVSPINAREELADFLSATKKDLLIYDPCVGDPKMVRILEERNRAGVSIRLIGSLKRANQAIDVRPLAGMRLHTRTIIRDGRLAFVGSQSLRTPELDGRREVGMFVGDRRSVEKMASVFEEDWKASEAVPDQGMPALRGDKLAKKVAKAMTNELPPVGEVIEAVTSDLPSNTVSVEKLDLESLEESIKAAVKTVVRETIQEAAGRAQE
jgi:cardiolipin synthase